MAKSTQKWEQVRQEYDNRYWLDNATIHYKYNLLDLKFLIAPTYGDGQPISGKTRGPKATPNRYSIFIRFFDINKVIPDYEAFKNADQSTKQSFIDQLLKTCSVKIFSDDPSFLYQGMWVDCEKHGLALFKLDPSIAALDKGIWRNRHGMQNTFRVTKHIGQLSLAARAGSMTVARSVAMYLDSHPERFVEKIDLNENKLKLKLVENIQAMNKIKMTEISLGDLVKELDIKVNDDLSSSLERNLRKAIQQDRSERIYDRQTGGLKRGEYVTAKREEVEQKFKTIGFEDFVDEFYKNAASVNDKYWATICLMLEMVAGVNSETYRKDLAELYKTILTKSDSELVGFSYVLAEYKKVLEKFIKSSHTPWVNLLDCDRDLSEEEKEELKKNKNYDPSKTFITLQTVDLANILYSIYRISGTGKKLLNRNMVGSGELLLAFLFGGRKQKDGGDITLSSGERIEIKSGMGRLDGGRVKAAVLTDDILKKNLAIAYKEVLGLEVNPNSLELIVSRSNALALAKKNITQNLETAPDMDDEFPMFGLEGEMEESKPLESQMSSTDFEKELAKLKKANYRVHSGILDFGQQSFSMNWSEQNKILEEKYAMNFTERREFFLTYIEECYKVRFSNVWAEIEKDVMNRLHILSGAAANMTDSNRVKMAKEMVGTVADIDFLAYCLVNYKAEHQSGDNHDSVLFTKAYNGSDGIDNLKFLAVSVKGKSGASGSAGVNEIQQSRIKKHVDQGRLAVKKFDRDSRASNVGLGIKN